MRKIEAEMRSEESKMVPLKEVEELEKEISLYSEITR